ncbi:MAG: hypothetical protein H7316_02965 [Tardiphaga sp.]|uniref:hypothetical protein n=1 Tax=Tardiphaga sp. TaxID=1926292 RepID=UPI0019B4686F|nr:hypothetical protein [Tardiphaga sp.]MBC7582693.1 hypothetical protein [Tardiphaga sp.]
MDDLVHRKVEDLAALKAGSLRFGAGRDREMPILILGNDDPAGRRRTRAITAAEQALEVMCEASGIVQFNGLIVQNNSHHAFRTGP